MQWEEIGREESPDGERERESEIKGAEQRLTVSKDIDSGDVLLSRAGRRRKAIGSVEDEAVESAIVAVERPTVERVDTTALPGKAHHLFFILLTVFRTGTSIGTGRAGGWIRRRKKKSKERAGGPKEDGRRNNRVKSNSATSVKWFSKSKIKTRGERRVRFVCVT